VLLPLQLATGWLPGWLASWLAGWIHSVVTWWCWIDETTISITGDLAAV
jgi:hypothetical protein